MGSALLRFTFADGTKINILKELKENYSDHQEEIEKLIVTGELAEFLDWIDEPGRKLILKGQKDGKDTTTIKKELADEWGINLKLTKSSKYLVIPTSCLKDVLENSKQNIDFPKGQWEKNDKITITCGYAIGGYGKDATELRIAELEIDIPNDKELTIKNIFFKTCNDEDSVIKVIRGKVLFQSIKFEKVRLETAMHGTIKLENCEFILLSTAALTEYDDSKIEYDNSTNFIKCKEPYRIKKVTNEDKLRRHIDRAVGKFLYQESVNNNGLQYLENAYNEEITHWQQAAVLKWPQALTLMGCCYAHGVGVEKDLAKAEELFREAANEEYLPSMYELGNVLEELNHDRDEYVDLWNRAAEKGYAGAQAKIGRRLVTGECESPRNMTVGDKWLRKAVEQDNCFAQYYLGSSYLVGEYGINKNYGEGIRLLKLAADKELAEAEYKLWEELKDKDEALKWLKRAAKHGDADAQNSLGVLYAKGNAALNIKQDADEALKWYREAAENGHKGAKKRLRR